MSETLEERVNVLKNDVLRLSDDLCSTYGEHLPSLISQPNTCTEMLFFCSKVLICFSLTGNLRPVQSSWSS